MEKNRWVVGLIFAAFWIIYLGPTQPLIAQSVQTIFLKPIPGLLHPREFYIKQVLDGRREKSTIGYILNPPGSPLRKQPLALNGGVANAVKGLIQKSVTNNSKLRPVIITINELQISETVQPDGVISGNVRISVGFEVEKEFDRVKLIEYRGGTKYSRSANRQLDLEPVISKNIGNALEFFDKWIRREAPYNEKLALGVDISISDVSGRAEQDTLFYDDRKSLSWSDFKSRPDMNSRFAAEVFPFFSFEESRKVENSTIYIDLKLKVYLVRSFSWVKAFARSAITLNHEQRHFDMVKIASERFKKRLESEKFTADNYQGILSVEYLECLREMNRLQKQYDSDTRHGTNQVEQERWNRRIDEELRSYNLLNVNHDE